ncbi:MAG: tripartite tricarboxylate transporter substrate binding protein [Alphaproteobacteria bacterium]|nr:tripartite tricarboxylate transporter substrate binding protein [Alphaproteobacteria bacterium]
MLTRRSLLAASAGLAAASGLAAPAIAQGAWPNRAIRMVVPFPPGGAVDLIGRMVADGLSGILGQQVVVDNRGGAGGNIGGEAVARSAPDGYTILIAGSSIICGNKYLYNRMPFDPEKDLSPVSMVTTGTVLCVVNSQRPWQSFKELVEHSKANPDMVKMGSSGVGTTSHLTISAVNRYTGSRILHVPYRGGAPAISDLVAGNLDMMFDVMPALLPHVDAGRFRALAVGTQERDPGAPSIPGMRELGYPQIDFDSWNGLFVRAGTPQPILDRLHAATQRVVNGAEFRSRLRGAAAKGSASLADFAAQVARDTPKWRNYVEISGAKLD